MRVFATLGLLWCCNVRDCVGLIGGADILVCHRTRYSAGDILRAFKPDQIDEYIDLRQTGMSAPPKDGVLKHTLQDRFVVRAEVRDAEVLRQAVLSRHVIF